MPKDPAEVLLQYAGIGLFECQSAYSQGDLGRVGAVPSRVHPDDLQRRQDLPHQLNQQAARGVEPAVLPAAKCVSEARKFLEDLFFYEVIVLDGKIYKK